MSQFLEFDKGRKDHTITVKVQYELLEAVEKLSAGNNSQFVREALIKLVRKEIENGNPKLKGEN